MGRKPTYVFHLLLVVLGVLFFALFLVNFKIPPFEDAAILMRYADHFAGGHGIVWNIGEPPVEGATDFLFMVAIALLHRVGFSLELSTRGLAVFSHVMSILLIYLAMRKTQKAKVLPAVLSAMYFAVGPGFFLAASYFGTPFFVLGVLATWILGQRIMFAKTRTLNYYIFFSAAALVTGLIRPEGVFISIFILMAVCVMIPLRDSIRLVIAFGSFFLLFGGIYFVWRWHYFGYPFPNAYYKKGARYLYKNSLYESVKNVFYLCYAFIPAFLLSLRGRKTLRLAFAFLIPIVGSTAMWIFLSNEMNFGARFQYPVFAIAILSWYPLVKTFHGEPGHSKLRAFLFKNQHALFILGLAIFAGLFFARVWASRNITYSQDGRYDMGFMLSDYAHRGYTIATTEAGLVPLYSRWKTIDAWGLNDTWIAHNRGITQEYLQKINPELILWHEYFSPVSPPGPNRRGDWFRMVMTLKRYAELNNYTLAAAFGPNKDNTHYYYVRSDIPGKSEIIDRIRSIKYIWSDNGIVCENYALNDE